MKATKLSIDDLCGLFVSLDEIVGHSAADAEWLAGVLRLRSAQHRAAVDGELRRFLPDSLSFRRPSTAFSPPLDLARRLDRAPRADARRRAS